MSEVATVRPGPRNVGIIECLNCSKEVSLRINKKRRLYVFCDSPADGGCGGGFMSRSDESDDRLAARCKKWIDPKDREYFIGGAADPEPEPEPEDNEELEELEGELDPEPEEEPEPKAKDGGGPISPLWDD